MGFIIGKQKSTKCLKTKKKTYRSVSEKNSLASCRQHSFELNRRLKCGAKSRKHSIESQ